MEQPELLAPAGDMEMLSAAIRHGADSIYFGIKGINMRAGAKNFELDELEEVVKKCHDNDVKAYLCLNTIIYEDELNMVQKILSKAKKAKIDAIICWDMSIVSMAKELDIEIHLSTQASASNSAAIREYSKLGIKRAVIARECTLDDISKIKQKTGIEIEAFIHGAMCVAISGRCFLSEHLYGKSANRGECIQPCRRSYKIIDPETGKELTINNHFVMSPKDLCTISMIDKLMDAKIDCFKIEGRNRSPEYVMVAVQCYKEAIRLAMEKKLTEEKKRELKDRLKKVYNRDFSTGFYMSRPIEEWCDSYGSKSTHVKRYLGKVINFYKEPSVAEIKIETGNINKGDDLLFIGKTTGCIEASAQSMQIEDKYIENAGKGMSVGLKTGFVARKNDQVYVVEKRKNN